MIGTAYRVSKFMALVGLPFLGVVYFTAAEKFGLSMKLLGAIVVVDLCLGAVLHISQKNFKRGIARGIMCVTETPRGVTYLLELNDDPEYELLGKKEVRLQVRKRMG